MPTAVPYLKEHETIARQLVAETRRHDGLAPLDLEQFWADQEIAIQDPFGTNIPQPPFGAILTWETVFDELGIEENVWRYQHDETWQLELNRAFNNKAERIVGRRPLPETLPPKEHLWPQTKGLADVFEARTVWHDQSWWIQQSAHTEDELNALLDRVETRNIRDCILPPNWDKEKNRLTALGIAPPLYRGQRGPVTFATSIYGVENLILLILTNPDLAQRFRDAILRTILEIARILDEEAGYDPQTAPHGWGWADDNCCLLRPEMYEFFGYPILKTVFERYAPNPNDRRFQHSDSDMAHLLPILAQLNLTEANFGPTLTVNEIRKHMPRTIIDGQLAPFTYSRNEEENMVLEFLRDFEMAREQRGLLFATAGSINNGSRLTGMRLLMAAIQHYGKYA